MTAAQKLRWPGGTVENTGLGGVASSSNRQLGSCRSGGVPVLFSSSGFRAGGVDAGLQRDKPCVEMPTVVVGNCTDSAAGESELDTSFRLLAAWTAAVAKTDDVLAQLGRTA